MLCFHNNAGYIVNHRTKLRNSLLQNRSKYIVFSPSFSNSFFFFFVHRISFEVKNLKPWDYHAEYVEHLPVFGTNIGYADYQLSPGTEKDASSVFLLKSNHVNCVLWNLYCSKFSWHDPTDYRWDDGWFWVSAKDCQLPTPTSQKLRLE